MPRHHHRFVLEYRGKRIVSNGERFGVEAELITDCRYLSVTGAKTAIDSELALNPRPAARAYPRWLAREPVHNVPFFSDYRSKEWSCPCGWTGNYKAADIPVGCVGTLRCPGCGEPLLRILPPSDEGIERAAADGNEYARQELAQLAELERRDALWAEQALTKQSQLPKLDGDRLVFIWDLEPGGDDAHYVIRLGDQVIWRELARGDDPHRFNAVKKLMKKKYGKRFASVTPTEAAAASLLGGTWGVKLVPT